MGVGCRNVNLGVKYKLFLGKYCFKLAFITNSNGEI